MSDLKLFRLSSGGVSELQGATLPLERSLQTLFERNLEGLLGIRFLASEHRTTNGRIDTLGMDENFCPVIIEYKRASNENVINQGLFYLDWLMDHRRDFEWLVLERQGKDEAAKVEWSAPRLICIAGDFTRYDEHAVKQISRNIAQHEQAVISDIIAQGHAHELLRVSAYLDPAEVGRRLQAALAEALGNAGLDVPEEKDLRRAVNVVLVQFPTLLKDALRRAMQSCAEVVDAADLPQTWDSSVPLLASPKNLYSVYPLGMNTWEQRFADWLDNHPRVSWWTRNLPRPNAADDWSARIVLPDSGRGYYPDFVVCVEGRPKPSGIALAETKERIESEASAAKSRSEHREYGRALMISYDPNADRFLRIEYAPDFGRNREVGPLRQDDLLMD